MMYYYSIISFAVFNFFLVKFWQDETTEKTDLISWISLLAIMIFWPILLPISSWELIRKYLYS